MDETLSTFALAMNVVDEWRLAPRVLLNVTARPKRTAMTGSNCARRISFNAAHVMGSIADATVNCAALQQR